MRRLAVAIAVATALGAGVALVPAVTADEALPTLRNGADWRSLGPFAGRAHADVPAGGVVVPVAVAPDGGNEPAPDDAAWLAAGWVPGAVGDGRAAAARSRVATNALVDLHALTRANGAVAAGPDRPWEYAWPRDSSFVAVAFAATGHVDDAWRVLRFLSGVQLPDGGFEARYRLDGSGPPDDRPRQADGAGWVLWALDRSRTESGPSTIPADLRPLRDRATDYAMALTETGHRLPPASPDYWEVPERRVTLATVARSPPDSTLRRERMPQRVARRDRQTSRGRSTAARPAAQRVRARLRAARRLGRPRRRGRPAPSPVRDHDGHGRPDGLAALPGDRSSCRRGSRARRSLEGGRRLVDAGDRTRRLHGCLLGPAHEARRWLDWLAGHCTWWGSLPEKVLPDGAPAGPAPLAWTAALVVLTEHELADR